MAAFTRWETVKNILDRTIRGMGLPVPSSYVGNTDPLAVQFLQLLDDAGRELAGRYDWQMFSRTWLFSTTPPTLVYDLPEDFEAFIPNTGWNLTARIPLIGPMTDQQWALIQARNLGGTTLYMQYLMASDQIQFYFVPSDVQDISMGYTGRGWVANIDIPSAWAYQDTVLEDSDLVLYRSTLMQMFIKLKWREAKGFDTRVQKKDFEDEFSRITAADKLSPDLHLARMSRYPYITIGNLPDTGFGSSS